MFTNKCQIVIYDGVTPQYILFPCDPWTWYIDKFSLILFSFVFDFNKTQSTHLCQYIDDLILRSKDQKIAHTSQEAEKVDILILTSSEQ